MAALLAIAPVPVVATTDSQRNQVRVENYRPVFQACRRAGFAPVLAIRHMEIGGAGMVLTVDPLTLATRLERQQNWSCVDTDDEHQKNTRFVRAIHASDGSSVPVSDTIVNGGLLHGATPTGAFITGDLCPSRKPLDRAFLTQLETVQTPLPLALALSGTWLIGHHADFDWLQGQVRSGALQITWVDHSYHHPFVRGVPLAHNFLLMQGVDPSAEIISTERMLIANGEVPSVFFRFPGLVSSAALMRVAAEYHLIVLGAAAWLAKSPRMQPGDIVLVHPNGNEPMGLRIFLALLAENEIAKPLRAIEEAPGK